MVVGSSEEFALVWAIHVIATRPGSTAIYRRVLISISAAELFMVGAAERRYRRTHISLHRNFNHVLGGSAKLGRGLILLKWVGCAER